MNLNKFYEWPDPNKTKILLIFGIILFVVVYPIMTLFFWLSGYPTNFFSSQLSFSAQVLKAHYQVTNIDLYRIAQTFDYGFMVSYGCLLFCLALVIARKFNDDSIWKKIGVVIAFLGVIAACCDAIENGFIHAMLIDPLNFPDIWAILHSIFALIKWILLPFCILWIVMAFILIKIKK